MLRSRQEQRRIHESLTENLATAVGKEKTRAHEVPGADGAEAVAEVDEDEPHPARREDELPVGLERDLRPEQVRGGGLRLRPHSPPRVALAPRVGPVRARRVLNLRLTSQRRKGPVCEEGSSREL